MLLKIVNPNTTWSMTDQIGACARGAVGAGTFVQAVSPAMGPASIESHYDEALSVPGLLEEIAKGEADGVDGYVVACFGDPGLDAARELAAGPVLGIAQAAMHTATLLGRSFTVVTTLERTVGRAWDLAQQYGMAGACRNVRACEIPVLELESDPRARAVITAECRRAVEEDRVDVVVLGCAGLTALCADISADIGVPVVDGVAAATMLVEGLVRLQLRTAKHGEFAAPRAKAYAGLLGSFAIR